LFSVWLVICYSIIKFIIRFVGKFIGQNFKVNRIAVLVPSLLVVGFLGYYVLFSTPAKNCKTAYIESVQNGFKVTVKGKRLLMTHDPISAILRHTYEDSVSFLIPRQAGTIQSNEIEVSQGRFAPTGTISINRDNMVIKLFNDQAQKESDGWNGNYSLHVR
jgi:hypothetical protein